jgi:beta-lactam-binding protein with PASTA domain
VNWRGGARRAMPFVVAAASGFLLAYLLIAFFVFPATLVSSDRKIPNVVGLTLEDATEKLKQSGFEGARGERRYNDNAPANTVLEQSPPANAMEPEGTRVVLDLSQGQRKGEMPPIVGLTRQQAEAAVQKAGLVLGTVREEASTAPRGQVLTTHPMAGDKVPMPSPVDNVVSGAPASVEIPDVVGSTYTQASSMLTQLGFVVAQPLLDSASTLTANSVTAQTPAAGHSVPAGTKVTLTIATGTGTVPP